jgi:hypothetical protein
VAVNPEIAVEVSLSQEALRSVRTTLEEILSGFNKAQKSSRFTTARFS